MAASFRVVAGPTSFTDNTEHAVTLTDTVAAGETLVALIACSVTDINGIVGYVDADDGSMTTTADCATQTTWQKDQELGAAGGGGYNGLSCFSSFQKRGLASGTTIRFGVKHGSGGTFDASGFYHGQSPYIVVVALNSGDSSQFMVYDASAAVATGATTTPSSPSITVSDNSIALGFFGGTTTVGAGWFTTGSGWTTELADTAQGTESNFNIACEGRLVTSSTSLAATGTSSVSANFGALVVSYKATTTEPSPGPTILAGTRETDFAGPGDFFSNGNTGAFPFVAAASGTSARMGARFTADNAGITTVKLGIYSHDSGLNRPLTLLGSGTVSINPVNFCAFGATVSGVNIVQGTTYWLAFSGAGEQVDINGVSSASFGREGTGNMVTTWVNAGNMQVKPGIWIETADPGPPGPPVVLPTPPLPRAFQEQGRLYSDDEPTGFQPLAFQVPDPTRGFQEGAQFGEQQGFQPNAFQFPDPTYAFQPEAFWNAPGFQMPVHSFQEDSGFQGDAFQEWFKQAGAAGPSLTTLDSVGNIASAEAFGNATHVQFVVATIAIASAEAFGTTRVQRVVKQAGAIASAEAFGTTKVIRVVGPTGIASSEAFGRPTLVTSIIRSAGGIASAEAFGTTHVLFVVKPIGITSAEAFGTTRVLSPQYVSAAGAIASAEAFGVPKVIRIVGNVGAIASAEAFGRPTLVTSIIRSAGGIPSAESFGQADRVIRIVGKVGAIASSEAFGTPQVSIGVYFVTGVGAIPSAEAFGQATHVLFIVRGIGIASAQAFGTAQLPRLLRLTTGISSAEAFGQSDRVRRVVGTLGISSSEAFGTPTKSPQVVFVHPGIASSESWGRPTVFDATIQTASAFGKVYLSDVAVFRLVVVDDGLGGSRISDNRTFAGVIDDTSGG